MAIRKGKHSCAKYLMYHFVSNSKISSSFVTFTITSVHIPNNIQEALYGLEWKKVVLEEMNVMEKNQTWRLEDLL